MPQKRKLQANIIDEYRCKHPQQNFSKQFSNTLKSSYTMIKLDLFQGCKDSSIYANKMDNLEEMDKFLEKYNFPNWTRKKQKILTDPSQARKLKL